MTIKLCNPLSPPPKKKNKKWERGYIYINKEFKNSNLNVKVILLW